MKKILSGILAASLAASMGALSVSAIASTAGRVYNGDLDEYLGGVGSGGTSGSVYDSTTAASIRADGIVPSSTIYFSMGDMTAFARTGATGTTGAFSVGSASNALDQSISIAQLTNSDYFKFKLDKNDNAKMINNISVVSDKKLDSKISAQGDQRAAFLKIVLNDSLTTSEIKATGTVTFTARGNTPSSAPAGAKWYDGDKFTYDYTLWINNQKVTGTDGSAETGDRVFFNPSANDKNTFVWGDDRAAIEFNADDDASNFYCRLSTSNNSSIYAEYGDPVGAELWFFDFVGNMNIPSTSRAALTLGIPWDQDKDITPNIADIRIYSIDADGMLSDVTDDFQYSEDAREIEGWTTQTRVLGSYIMSDTELDIAEEEVVDDTISDDIGDEDIVVDEPITDKPIPNTGSSDMVSVAVVAAVVSLAAAGAVAFKKASK